MQEDEIMGSFLDQLDDWPPVDFKFDIPPASFPSSPTPPSPFAGPDEGAGYIIPPGASNAFPPPPQMNAPSATEVINSLLQHQINQEAQLGMICEQQRLLFNNLTQEGLQVLYTEQKGLREKLLEELTSVDALIQQVILTPSELHRVDYLRNEFSIQIRQLELYLSEIEQIAYQQRVSKPLATLLIVRQPFPCVPSKGHSLMDGELVVQLLVGAATKVLGCSPVKGMAVAENNQTKGETKTVDHVTQPLDSNTLKANFPALFCEGTRKNAAQLRFIVDVQLEQLGQQVTGSLESIENSFPFVIMTNQKQWEGCERTLLFRDAFVGQLEITWWQFANALQRQFIRATRQDPQNPSRCLSVFDFSYLHDKFLKKRTIFPQKEYDAFWNWYGKCIQVIRYQRHIGQLFQDGLLYGFMTREEVNMALTDEPIGTFVLRFSERHAGQIGIAYVETQVNHIKHYLVQPNDTAAAKFTLPDFLRDKPQFAFILQFTLLPSGTPQFKRFPKDQVLESLYSKRIGGDTSGSGYDPL